MKKGRIHEFEVKMEKWEVIVCIIAISIFSICSIIYYFVKKGDSSICLLVFWINQFIILMVLKSLKNTKIMRKYFLHRITKKNEGCLCAIFTFASAMIPGFLHLTWYNIVITLLLSSIYEYLCENVKVTQNYIIE